MNNQRLTEIETKLAHQEFLIGELNEVIAKQQETIDQLQAGLKSFIKHFRERNSPAGPAGEKPPHY